MQVCNLLQTDNHASTHHSVFYRPDALPAPQPTVSKHWRYSWQKENHSYFAFLPHVNFLTPEHQICMTWCLLSCIVCLMYSCTHWRAAGSDSSVAVGVRYGAITSVRSLPDKFCAFINFKNKKSAAQALVGLQVCVSRGVCELKRTWAYMYWVSYCMPSVLWRCWLGGRKGIRPVKNWVVRCWRGYLSGARCRLAWPSWCCCHSLSLASVKPRLVLPFWYRPTWVVLEKGPLNGCVCKRVCVYKYVYLSIYFMISTGWGWGSGLNTSWQCLSISAFMA